MIQLSKLKGKKFYLNAELVEEIEETPDTVITLIGGKTVMVADSVEQVIEKIINYRKTVYNLSSTTVPNSIKMYNKQNE